MARDSLMNGDKGTRSITDEAYEFIFQKIVNCEYPPGYELNAKDIVNETGFGITPVRESLLILQKAGMLTIRPHKGIIITPITERRTREHFQTRRLIEPAIMVENCHIYSKEKLFDFSKQFEKDYELTDYERFTQDIRFHSYLMSVANNRRLDEIYEDILASQIRSAVYEALHNPNKHKGENIRQHQMIIDMLIKENRQGIHDAIMYHLSYAENNILRVLKREADGGK